MAEVRREGERRKNGKENLFGDGGGVGDITRDMRERERKRRGGFSKNKEKARERKCRKKCYGEKFSTRGRSESASKNAIAAQ